MSTEEHPAAPSCRGSGRVARLATPDDEPALVRIEIARTVARGARIPGLDEAPRCAMIRRTRTRGAGCDGTDRGRRG